MASFGQAAVTNERPRRRAAIDPGAPLLNRVAGQAPNLRANFLWTLGGSLVNAACQWGMLLVLAKLGDAAMVGQYALALALTAPILMFSNLHLRSVQATDARGDYVFGDYLGLRLAMTAAALCCVGGLAAFLDVTATTAFVIVLVGVAKAGEAIGDVYHGLLQKHERMPWIAVSLMLKGVLALTVFALTVHVTQSMVWGAAAVAAAMLVVLTAYDIPRAAALRRQTGDGERVTPRWHMPTLLRLTRLALPLGLVMFVMSFTANIPRYYIEHYQGLYDLGIFAALSSILVAAGRAQMALGESLSPRLAKCYAAGDRKQFGALLARLLWFSALLGGAMVLAALVLGREILTLFFRAEYGEHADVFVWVAAGGALGYLVSSLGYGVTAARYFFVQAPLHILAGVVTALACAWLVPTHHLVGAAWAVALGLLVPLLGSAIILVHALAMCPPAQASSPAAVGETRLPRAAARGLEPGEDQP